MASWDSEPSANQSSSSDSHSAEHDGINVLNDVLLVLDSKPSVLGGCSLSLSERKLCLIEEIHIDSGVSLDTMLTLSKILSKIGPSQVIVSSRLNESIYNELERQSSIRNFTIDVLRVKSFLKHSIKRPIQDLLRALADNRALYPTLNAIEHSIGQSIASGCLGALLISLGRCELFESRDIDRNNLFQSVEVYACSDTVYIEPETLYALQILKENDSGLNKKDSHHLKSLFGMVNQTHSALGYKRLRSWFYAPLANISLINKRLNTVEVLISEDNTQYLENLMRFQKQLPNINQTISSIEMGRPSVKSWSQMASFLKYAIEIYDVVGLMKDIESVEVLQNILAEVDIEQLRNLCTAVDSAIDFDQSKQWKRVYVRDGLVNHLDSCRKNYDRLETTLEEAASEISIRYPHVPSTFLNVVYLPQVGYLISIDITNRDDVPEEWEEVFATVTNMYYKDEYTHGMDDELGDVYQLIIDLEIEVLYELQSGIFDSMDMLLTAGELFAELDCFMSLASISMLQGYVRPEIVDESVIEIKNGRNPIFENLVPSYISNNTDIEKNRLCIVTGANGSGKSLYLLQVGIIVYLAHLGCFVPAQFAKIGLTDKILSRIFSMESLEKCESSFALDLQKMSKCLQLGTEKSLLLIDEFGKGTDVIGGPALLGAIIENLSNSETPPRTIITTHFHELFKNNIIELSSKVKHNHMSVIIQQQDGEDKLTYLYELKDGLALNSFGIEYVLFTFQPIEYLTLEISCAKACGIPNNIITRANEILRESHESLISSVDSSKYRDIEQAKYIAREFLTWDLETEESQTEQELKEHLNNTLHVINTL